MTTPERGTIDIPKVSRRYVPPLEYRDTDYPHMKDPDFAMRCRLNGNNFLMDEKHGDNVRYHHFVHTFNDLVPVEDYFEEHPEYFSEIDGKRTRERTQLCLTNPRVLKIAIERVCEWIEERPDARIFSVSQNDGAPNPCQCAECRKIAEREGSEIGPILHFVNAVADSIKEKHPDKIISTLAYTYSRKPPRRVRPRPNVTVRLCSIECCFAHPLAVDPFNKTFVDDIREWSRVCKRLSIWDYVINYSHSIAPFPNLYAIRPNIKFFVENGATSVYEEACYYTKGSELAELRGYVVAKTLWDPDYDTETAIDEFVDAYYGPAAPYVREYLDSAHAPFRDGKGPCVGIYHDPLEYMPEGFAPKMHALFMKARAAVEDDPVFLDRVRVAHLPVTYLLLKGRHDACELEKDMPPMSPQERDWLQEFCDVAEAAGVTHVREGERGLIRKWLDSFGAPPGETK